MWFICPILISKLLVVSNRAKSCFMRFDNGCGIIVIWWMFCELICYDHFRFVFFSKNKNYDIRELFVTMDNILLLPWLMFWQKVLPVWLLCSLGCMQYAHCLEALLQYIGSLLFLFLNKPSYTSQQQQHKIIQKVIIDDLIYLR